MYSFGKQAPLSDLYKPPKCNTDDLRIAISSTGSLRVYSVPLGSSDITLLGRLLGKRSVM